MRLLNLRVLGAYLAMVMLTSVGCEKQPMTSTATAVKPGPSANAATAVVALPNFTALVKKEGAAVINISTTQKVKLQRTPFPELPG